MPAPTQIAGPDGAFATLLGTAIKRLLHDEPLGPFCNWFAGEMTRVMTAPGAMPSSQADDARRFQRSVARQLWAAVPVPSNRWRPRPLPKTERNDPCHCGSGRKYKQCCAEFAGMALPLEDEGFFALALAQADPAMLSPDRLRQVPPEALGIAANQWNDKGECERSVAVLEPLFLQRDDLDARHEMAFDMLMDALLTLGRETRREQLVQRISQSRDKTLATAARCRHVSMLADRGEHDAAWALFHATQRFNPNDAQLWHLELTLLLAQGREDEARLRGPVLAAKARKAGLPELAGMLVELAEQGLAAAAGDAGPGALDDPEDLDWIALCDQVPPQPAPDEWCTLYNVTRHASSEPGQAAVLSVAPVKKLQDLQRRWRRRFPVDKPMLTHLTGDARLLLDELPTAMQFLQTNPQAWLSIEVLDDLLLAAAELCDWEASPQVLQAAQRLATHALAGLHALLDPSPGQAQAELHWADVDARPLLRVLAQAIDLARLMRQRKTEEALAQWGLALNPNDNHGWRSLLAPLWLAQSRFDEVLGLLDRYPDDMPPAEHHRALALFALGRRDEAQRVLGRAHADYPLMLGTLLPEVPDPPEDEGGPGLTLGGAMSAFYNRVETRAIWVSTGALAWARSLNLPEPAPKRPKAPKSAKPAKTAKTGKSAGPGTAPAGADLFGATQEKHLRLAFSDYPRLHGLLTAIAWSPDMVMPMQWLQLALQLRKAPPAAADESNALKAMNKDLEAMMRLYNSLNSRLLATPPDQPAPVQEVLKLATATQDGVFAWAAGFVQGAELVAGAWRRTGRPVSAGKGAFGELHALAARAAQPGDGWRPTQDSGQPLLIGLDNGAELPVERLALSLADLWRVIAPLRQARLHGG
jgi:yecA family protein